MSAVTGAAPRCRSPNCAGLHKVPAATGSSSLAAIERSAAVVADIINGGRTVYGVNTGFGSLAQTTIPNERLAELQRRLVLSHSVGVGDLLPDSVVRLVIALKIVGLARGFSGVRPW